MPISDFELTLDEKFKKLSKEIEKSLFFVGKLNGQIIENMILKTIKIDEIEFPIRFCNAIKTFNFLSQSKITNLLELLNTDYNVILAQPNCGIKSVYKTRTSIRAFLYNNQKAIVESMQGLITKNLQQTRDYKQNHLEHPQFDFGDGRTIFLDKINKDILNIKIEKIKFPIRFHHLLVTNKRLKTIRDLLNLSYQDFIKTRNVGRITIKRVYEKVYEIITSDDYKKYLEVDYRSKSLPLIINEFLEEITTRDKEVALKRWGSKSGKTSLEVIGKEYNLTRERIRQILVRIIRSFNDLIDQNKLKDFYQKVFLEILSFKPGPINYLDLDDKLLDNKYGENFYLGFLADIFTYVPFEGHLLKGLEQLARREKSQNKDLNRLYNKLCETILPYKTITTRTLVDENIFNLKNDKEKLLLYKSIFSSKRFVFKKIENEYYLCKISSSFEELVPSILLKNDKALHINEIINVIRNELGIKDKYETLQSFLSLTQRINGVYQVDRYVLGLLKHFSYSPENWKHICSKAKEIMKIRGNQLYITEIMNEIKKDFPLLRSKYELVHILRSDTEIIDLEFFTFNLKENRQQERVKAKDLILRIFTISDKPKHFNDILVEIHKERHFRTEGIGCMLKQLDFLIAYPGGYYGLSNKDAANLEYLSLEESFVVNYFSHHSFPDTRIIGLENYFKEERLRSNVANTIKYSSRFYTCINENIGNEFVLIKDWSLIKAVRCILFNWKEEMFWDEIKWILNDIGIEDHKLLSEKYKICNDRFIQVEMNKLRYVEHEIDAKLEKEILEYSYIITSENKEAYRLEDLYNKVISRNDLEELSIEHFLGLLKDDDRFLVSRNIITVKS